MDARRYGIYLRVFTSISNECAKRTNNDVFEDFPKISDHFPKISEDFPKLFRRLDERLRTFSRTFSEDYRRLPKVAEDFRGGTDDVSIIHHLWVLFKRLCYYSNGNLKTCDQSGAFPLLELFWSADQDKQLSNQSVNLESREVRPTK